jgi:hypothetical protein
MTLPEALREILHDAASPRKRPWILVAIGLIVVLAAWKNKLGAPRPAQETPDTIEYHYDQWRHHKANLVWGVETNRLSVRKLVWHLDGKPTFTERMDKVQYHFMSLVRLGYFEERQFMLPETNVPKFKALWNAQTHSNFVKKLNIEHIFHSGTNVVITARPENMPAIEAMMSEELRASSEGP